MERLPGPVMPLLLPVLLVEEGEMKLREKTPLPPRQDRPHGSVPFWEAPERRRERVGDGTSLTVSML